MKRSIIIIAFLLLIISPGFIQAQWSVAPHVVISIPNADFANVSGTGGGFGIKAIRDFRSMHGIGLRGDFAFISHGKDFGTVGGYISEIRHQSFRLTFGPQYSLGTRKFKVHAEVSGGFYIFRTNEDIQTNFGFFQDSSGDAALGWNFGGGFQYDIGLGPWLDVALEYQTIYNIPQIVGIDEATLKSITTDITAHEITLKIGVIFFLK